MQYIISLIERWMKDDPDKRSFRYRPHGQQGMLMTVGPLRWKFAFAITSNAGKMPDVSNLVNYFKLNRNKMRPDLIPHLRLLTVWSRALAYLGFPILDIWTIMLLRYDRTLMAPNTLGNKCALCLSCCTPARRDEAKCAWTLSYHAQQYITRRMTWMGISLPADVQHIIGGFLVRTHTVDLKKTLAYNLAGMM